MDLIWHGLEHVLEELPGRLSVSRCDELSDSVKLALGGLHLGDVDVKESDGIAFELLAPLSPSTSGRRKMPCRCRYRCSADRVRCGRSKLAIAVLLL